MAGSKKIKQQNPMDDGFDTIALGATNKSSADQLAGYFLVGFFMTLMPAYLYHSVFDMSVSENAPIYLIITLAAAAMLTLAYRNVEQGTFAFLSSSRKTGRYASAQSKSKEETDALLYQESLAWSLFLNNIIFVAAFLFLAFYVLRSVETLYNYILSVVIAALITWQLSNGSAPR